MIDIRAHSKSDYAALPDIDSPMMNANDQSDLACLDEIGELLIAKGANNRFGVTLLHSHFPIGDNEIVVERPHASERKFTLRPLEGCEMEGVDHVAINLQFCSGGDNRALTAIGMEFIRSEALAGVAPVSANDALVLRDVRDVLERRNLLRRFGVSLLHDAIGLGDSEILLETCDLSSRTLHCVAAGRDDDRVSNGIETTWSWSVPAVAGATAPEATRLCRRQCTRVCLTPAGGSHQSGGHEPSGHEVGPD